MDDRYERLVTEKEFMELRPELGGISSIAKYGLSRTIIGHLFEDPNGKMEEMGIVVHHRSDATWMVEIGDEEIEQVNIRHVYLMLAAMGYRRTYYQIIKANIDLTDHPDLWPFGCEYSWKIPAAAA